MKGTSVNPCLYILLFLVIFWAMVIYLAAKPTKNFLNSFIFKEQATETKKNADKTKKKTSEKTNLNENVYFSISYSADIDDEEKIITTAGIICVLENGNVIHITMTAENIDGRMRETEETVRFLIKHQDEIFDDLIRTIVEDGQRGPTPDKPDKKERLPQPQNEKIIKKKV